MQNASLDTGVKNRKPSLIAYQECIGDFKTRQLAEEVLAQITGGPTVRELLYALMGCIWWWDTQPTMVRNLEEPEAFARGRVLIARAVAA